MKNTYTSNSEFDLETKVQLTNEVPIIKSYDQMNDLLKNDTWGWLIGKEEVNWDAYKEKELDPDWNVEENGPGKFVNGKKAENYSGNDRLEISGVLSVEQDLFLHEIYRYLSNLYPDHPDWLNLLTRNEIIDAFNDAAALVDYKPNNEFFRILAASIDKENTDVEEFKLNLRNLYDNAMRRKFYGSLLGYRMYAHDIYEDISLFPLNNILPLMPKSEDEKDQNNYLVDVLDPVYKTSFRRIDWLGKSRDLSYLKEEAIFDTFTPLFYENCIFEYNTSFEKDSYLMPDKSYLFYDYLDTVEKFDGSISSAILEKNILNNGVVDPSKVLYYFVSSGKNKIRYNEIFKKSSSPEKIKYIYNIFSYNTILFPIKEMLKLYEPEISAHNYEEGPTENCLNSLLLKRDDPFYFINKKDSRQYVLKGASFGKIDFEFDLNRSKELKDIYLNHDINNCDIYPDIKNNYIAKLTSNSTSQYCVLLENLEKEYVIAQGDLLVYFNKEKEPQNGNFKIHAIFENKDNDLQEFLYGVEEIKSKNEFKNSGEQLSEEFKKEIISQEENRLLFYYNKEEEISKIINNCKILGFFKKSNEGFSWLKGIEFNKVNPEFDEKCFIKDFNLGNISVWPKDEEGFTTKRENDQLPSKIYPDDLSNVYSGMNRVKLFNDSKFTVDIQVFIDSDINKGSNKLQFLSDDSRLKFDSLIVGSKVYGEGVSKNTYITKLDNYTAEINNNISKKGYITLKFSCPVTTSPKSVKDNMSLYKENLYDNNSYKIISFFDRGLYGSKQWPNVSDALLLGDLRNFSILNENTFKNIVYNFYSYKVKDNKDIILPSLVKKSKNIFLDINIKKLINKDNKEYLMTPDWLDYISNSNEVKLAKEKLSVGSNLILEADTSGYYSLSDSKYTDNKLKVIFQTQNWTLDTIPRYVQIGNGGENLTGFFKNSDDEIWSNVYGERSKYDGVKYLDKFLENKDKNIPDTSEILGVKTRTTYQDINTKKFSRRKIVYEELTKIDNPLFEIPLSEYNIQLNYNYNSKTFTVLDILFYEQNFKDISYYKKDGFKIYKKKYIEGNEEKTAELKGFVGSIPYEKRENLYKKVINPTNPDPYPENGIIGEDKLKTAILAHWKNEKSTYYCTCINYKQDEYSETTPYVLVKVIPEETDIKIKLIYEIKINTAKEIVKSFENRILSQEQQVALGHYPYTLYLKDGENYKELDLLKSVSNVYLNYSNTFSLPRKVINEGSYDLRSYVDPKFIGEGSIWDEANGTWRKDENQQENKNLKFNISQSKIEYDEKEDAFITYANEWKYDLKDKDNNPIDDHFDDELHKCKLKFEESKYFKNTKRLLGRLVEKLTIEEGSVNKVTHYMFERAENEPFDISDLNTSDSVLNYNNVFLRSNYNENLEPVLFDSIVSLSGEIYGIDLENNIKIGGKRGKNNNGKLDENNLNFFECIPESEYDENKKLSKISLYENNRRWSSSLPLIKESKFKTFYSAANNKVSDYAPFRYFKNLLVIEGKIREGSGNVIESPYDDNGIFTKALEYLRENDKVIDGISLSSNRKNLKTIKTNITEKVKSLDFTNSKVLAITDNSIYESNLPINNEVTFTKLSLNDKVSNITNSYYSNTEKTIIYNTSENTSKSICKNYKNENIYKSPSVTEPFIQNEDGIYISTEKTINKDEDIINSKDIAIRNSELLEDGPYIVNSTENNFSKSFKLDNFEISIINNYLFIKSNNFICDNEGNYTDSMTKNKYWKCIKLPEYKDNTLNLLKSHLISNNPDIFVKEEIKNHIKEIDENKTQIIKESNASCSESEYQNYLEKLTDYKIQTFDDFKVNTTRQENKITSKVKIYLSNGKFTNTESDLVFEKEKLPHLFIGSSDINYEEAYYEYLRVVYSDFAGIYDRTYINPENIYKIEELADNILIVENGQNNFNLFLIDKNNLYKTDDIKNINNWNEVPLPQGSYYLNYSKDNLNYIKDNSDKTYPVSYKVYKKTFFSISSDIFVSKSGSQIFLGGKSSSFNDIKDLEIQKEAILHNSFWMKDSGNSPFIMYSNDYGRLWEILPLQSSEGLEEGLKEIEKEFLDNSYNFNVEYFKEDEGFYAVYSKENTIQEKQIFIKNNEIFKGVDTEESSLKSLKFTPSSNVKESSISNEATLKVYYTGGLNEVPSRKIEDIDNFFYFEIAEESGLSISNSSSIFKVEKDAIILNSPLNDGSEENVLLSINTKNDITDPLLYISKNNSKFSSYINSLGNFKVKYFTEVENASLANLIYLKEYDPVEDNSSLESYPTIDSPYSKDFYEYEGESIKYLKNSFGNNIYYCSYDGSKAITNTDLNKISLIDRFYGNIGLNSFKIAGKNKYSTEELKNNYDAMISIDKLFTLEGLSSYDKPNLFSTIKIIPNTESLVPYEENKTPQEIEYYIRRLTEAGEEFSEGRLISKTFNSLEYWFDTKYNCFILNKPYFIECTIDPDYLIYNDGLGYNEHKLILNADKTGLDESLINVSRIYFPEKGYGGCTDGYDATTQLPWKIDEEAFLDKKLGSVYLSDELGNKLKVNSAETNSNLPAYSSFNELLKEKGKIINCSETQNPDIFKFLNISVENNTIEFESNTDLEEFKDKIFELNVLTGSQQRPQISQLNNPDYFHELSQEELKLFTPDRVWYNPNGYKDSPIIGKNTIIRAESNDLFKSNDFFNRNNNGVYLCDEKGYFRILNDNDKELSYEDTEQNGVTKNKYSNIEDYVSVQKDRRIISKEPIYKSTQEYFRNDVYSKELEVNPFWQILRVYPKFEDKAWKQYTEILKYKKIDGTQQLINVDNSEKYFEIMPIQKLKESYNKDITFEEKGYFDSLVGDINYIIIDNKESVFAPDKKELAEKMINGLKVDRKFLFNFYKKDDEEYELNLNFTNTYKYSVCTLRDFSKAYQDDSTIVNISELGIFDVNHKLIAYAQFPPIQYRSDKQHASFTAVIYHGKSV